VGIQINIKWCDWFLDFSIQNTKSVAKSLMKSAACQLANFHQNSCMVNYIIILINLMIRDLVSDTYAHSMVMYRSLRFPVLILP